MAPNNKPKVKELWVAFPFRFPGGMWGGRVKKHLPCRNPMFILHSRLTMKKPLGEKGWNTNNS